MAVNVNLATLSTLNNQSILTQSNSNFSAIQTSLQNALSLNGQTPNQMQSNLDMNNNQILNLPPPATTNSPARLIDVVSNPTLSVPPVGTSGATVPLLNGNNTWSGTNNFTAGLTYQLPSSGSVATTISTKLNNWVSITDFGADPTGVTANFGTAFNAAMATMTTGSYMNGGTLYIPAGHYKIGTTVCVWSPGVNILADPGAYIQANVSIPQMIKSGVGSGNSLSSVYLQGGQWDGFGNVTQDGFTLPDFGIIDIRQLRMYNCSGNAGNGGVGGFIRLGAAGTSACFGLYMNNVHMINWPSQVPSIVSNNYGVFVDPSSTTGPTDSRFDDIQIVGASTGFNGPFYDGVFTDGHIWCYSSQGALTHGFKLTSGQCRLSNCQVDSPIVAGSAAYDLSTTFGGTTVFPYALSTCGVFENINNNTTWCVNVGSNTFVYSYGNHFIGTPSTKILFDYVGNQAGVVAHNDFIQNVISPAGFGLYILTGTSGNQAVPTSNIIVNPSGTFTITLQSPNQVVPGTTFNIKTIANVAVNSSINNVVPLAGGSPGTAILSATAGKWATLQNDTANWNIIASN